MPESHRGSLNILSLFVLGISVYNVVTLSTIGITVSMLLEGTEQYEALYAMSSLCILIATTVTLCVVFVPKVTVLRNIEAMEAQTVNAAINTMNGSRLPTSSTQEMCEKCQGCGCRFRAKSPKALKEKPTV